MGQRRQGSGGRRRQAAAAGPHLLAGLRLLLQHGRRDGHGRKCGQVFVARVAAAPHVALQVAGAGRGCPLAEDGCDTLMSYEAHMHAFRACFICAASSAGQSSLLSCAPLLFHLKQRPCHIADCTATSARGPAPAATAWERRRQPSYGAGSHGAVITLVESQGPTPQGGRQPAAGLDSERAGRAAGGPVCSTTGPCSAPRAQGSAPACRSTLCTCRRRSAAPH